MTVFSALKMLFCSILSGLVLADIGSYKDYSDLPQIIFVSEIMKFIAYLIATSLILFERIRGIITSGVLFIFWLLSTLAGIIPFYSRIILKDHDNDAIHFGLFFTSYTLILVELFLHCFAEVGPKEPLKATEKPINPEVEASFPARLTYTWMTNLITRAYKKALTEDDLWQLHPRDQIKQAVPAFVKTWNKETSKCHEKNVEDELLQNKQYKKVHQLDDKKKPSLFSALAKVYLPELSKSWGLKLFSDVLTFAGPAILSKLISFTASQEPPWKGYALGVALLMISTLQSIVLQYSMHISTILSMRMRGVLTSVVFRKALSSSNDIRQNTTIGQIVNVMSVDCQRVQEVVPFSYLLISSPLQISLALYFLYQLLGPSIFAGFALYLLFIPLNAIIMVKIRNYQAKQMKIKDTRIKLMSEVLNGIKVLKLYAWEKSFQKKINDIRSKEITLLRKTAYLNAVATFSLIVAPFLVIFVTFATYVLSSEDNKLDAQKAFVSLSLFNILRSPIDLFPLFMSFVMPMTVSLDRIGKFLSNPELSSDNVDSVTEADHAISVKNGKFLWSTERENSFTLKNINIDIPTGKLFAIVGSVGAGKSSLISAILGEMEKCKGSVEIQGSVAYVPQEAWIQNNTLKNNILFGKDYDQRTYDKVIEACALTPDLDVLPGGNDAEIGDKGINLSGGQRQRVSLARAIYNNADIYMLDNPLSAVDSHVGKHIFNKVVGQNGLLRNKTRILVTHGIQWLPQVDYILVMTDGQISEWGTYNDLIEHNGPFAQFLQSHLSQSGNKTVNDEEDPGVADIKSRMSVCSDNQCSPENKMEESSLTESMETQEKTHGNYLIKRKCHQSSPSLSENESSGSPINLKELSGSLQKDQRNKLIEAEKLETGHVKLKVFQTYVNSLGYTSCAIALVCYIIFQASSVFSSIWLSWWSEDKFGEKHPVNMTKSHDNLQLYLGVYGCLGLSQALCVLAYSIILAYSLLKAAKNLHNKLLDNILHCPMKFFDTTPLGRIINRFSMDIDTIDTSLPWTVGQIIRTMFIVLSTVFLISYVTPIFLVVLPLMVLVYYLIQSFYLSAARQLSRIESVTRSPIYSLFSETVIGAASVRAYKAQSKFIEIFENLVNTNFLYHCSSLATNRWLIIRLDIIGNLLVFVAALFAVAERESMTSGSIGLSLSYALNITFFIGIYIRNRGDLETNIVAVERVKEYSNIENEPAWITEPRLADSWPQDGNIDLDNFQLRYRPELDLVIKGITCHIKAGEKVGIVGRTGAGKSSLTISLFRLLEGAGGSIIIDGKPITEIGLHDLRSRLTILPQDPVIFSGNLRSNLDPFDQFSDHQIWRALEVAHLKAYVEGLPTQLNYECGEGGQNLSVGQHQLICLARSVLHKTKILILDEATAAVDMETDDLIQKTIRSEFEGITVLTIAHRLNTILDYDKIMVLDKGLLKEFDSPETLRNNKDSIFHGMVKDAGLF